MTNLTIKHNGITQLAAFGQRHKKDIDFLNAMQSITTELLYEKYDVTKLQHLDKMISDWKHELENTAF